MEVANTLTYYIMATIAALKFFIAQAPGLKPLILGWCASAMAVTINVSSGLYYKCFTIVIYNRYDSGQYYKTRITVVSDNFSLS